MAAPQEDPPQAETELPPASQNTRPPAWIAAVSGQTQRAADQLPVFGGGIRGV